MLNMRIGALRSDWSMELNGERKAVLQVQLQEREQERAQVEAELARLRGQL